MKDTYICVHVMYYFFKGKKSNELVYQMLDEGYWCAVVCVMLLSVRDNVVGPHFTMFDR